MHRAFIRFCTFVTAIVLLVFSCCATSAEVLFNAAFLRTSGLQDEGIRTVHCITYVGNTCFAYLDDESLRTYQDDGSLLLFCKLPNISLNPYIQPTMLEMKDIVTNITTDGDILYGWNVYSGQFGIISKTGIEWNDVNLQMKSLHPYGDIETYRIGASYVRNNSLYVFASLSEYLGKTEYRFYAYDLLSGKEKAYIVPDAVGLCPGKDNQFFFLCLNEKGWSIQILSTTTGEVVPYSVDMSSFSVDAVICGLVYSKEEDKIYFSYNDAVYAASPEELPNIIGSVSTIGCMSESTAWILSDNRYALCSMVGLNVVKMGILSNEQSQLTVQGSNLTKANVCFQTTYPNTTLNYISENISTEDLSVRLLTQDDSVDIYKVQADSTYMAIKKKGFLSSLSSSSILLQECNNIDEHIMDAITDGKGILVAYPASLSICTFGINVDYWNMVFNNLPIPRTLEELLDAWIMFEESYADAYPLLDMWYGFDEEFLCRNLLINYMQSHADSVNSFTGDCSLRVALEKLSRIAELREAHQRPMVEWTPDEAEGKATIFNLFAERDAMYRSPTFYLETQENMVYGISIFNYSPLTLSWNKEDADQTNASMAVYIINPYTKNYQEATRYIECASQLDVNPYLYYAIHPTLKEPYENPSFHSKIDAISEDMTYIESVLQKENLAYSDRLDFEAMLEYEKRVIQEQEQLKWMISVDTITEDRTQLSQLNLNLDNIYLTAMINSNDIEQLCSRYISGNLSLDLFLTMLANNLEMIRMEKQ